MWSALITKKQAVIILTKHEQVSNMLNKNMQKKHNQLIGSSFGQLRDAGTLELIHPHDLEKMILTLISNVNDGNCEVENTKAITQNNEVCKQPILALHEATIEFALEVEEKNSQISELSHKLKTERMSHAYTENERDITRYYNKAIFENSGTATAVLDGDLIVLTVNSLFEELTGYHEVELLGESIQSIFFTAESISKIVDSYSLLKQEPKGLRKIELQCIDRDGNVKIVLAHISIIQDIGNIMVSLIDITKQSRLELLSKDSENRFLTLFEKSPIGIAINRNTQIIYVNQAYLRLFGFESSSELGGTSIINQIAYKHRADITDKIRSREHDYGARDTHGSVGLKKDGTTFPILVETTDIMIDDGPANATFFRTI